MMVLVLPQQAPRGIQAATNQDTEFWLAFPENYDRSSITTLFITGDTATSGTVEVPGLATPFSEDFTVTPGTITNVVVPNAAQVVGTGTFNQGIHVTADNPITVYGLNRLTATTDAYLGLPVSSLGSEYIVMGYTPSFGGYPSEATVVATVDSTTVTVTPPGVSSFNVSLNEGQVYQHTGDPADLTGTIVTADQPVAVFGGVQCVNIPSSYGACDHIVEQMPPTSAGAKTLSACHLQLARKEIPSASLLRPTTPRSASMALS